MCELVCQSFNLHTDSLCSVTAGSRACRHILEAQLAYVWTRCSSTPTQKAGSHEGQVVSSGNSPRLAWGTGANNFTSMQSCITAKRRGRLELEQCKTKESRDLLSAAFCCRLIKKEMGSGRTCKQEVVYDYSLSGYKQQIILGLLCSLHFSHYDFYYHNKCFPSLTALSESDSYELISPGQDRLNITMCQKGI